MATLPEFEFEPIVNPFVSRPIGEFSRTIDQLNQDFDIALETDTNLQKAISQVPVAPFENDQAIFRDISTRFTNNIADRANQEDYEFQVANTQRDAANFSAEVQPIIRNQQAVQSFIQDIRERDDIADKPRIINAFLNRYANTGGLQRDEFGGLTNFFQPPSIAGDVDLFQIVNEAGDGIEKQLIESGFRKSNDPDKRGLFVNEQNEFVRPEVVKDVIEAAIMNNPNAQAFIQRELELGNELGVNDLLNEAIGAGINKFTVSRRSEEVRNDQLFLDQAGRRSEDTGVIFSEFSRGVDITPDTVFDIQTTKNDLIDQIQAETAAGRDTEELQRRLQNIEQAQLEIDKAVDFNFGNAYELYREELLKSLENDRTKSRVGALIRSGELPDNEEDFKNILRNSREVTLFDELFPDIFDNEGQLKLTNMIRRYQSEIKDAAEKFNLATSAEKLSARTPKGVSDIELIVEGLSEDTNLESTMTNPVTGEQFDLELVKEDIDVDDDENFEVDIFPTTTFINGKPVVVGDFTNKETGQTTQRVMNVSNSQNMRVNMLKIARQMIADPLHAAEGEQLAADIQFMPFIQEVNLFSGGTKKLSDSVKLGGQPVFLRMNPDNNTIEIRVGQSAETSELVSTQDSQKDVSKFLYDFNNQ